MFKKIVVVGIGETSLDPDYWKRIENVGESIVKLTKDSTEIGKELADADCLLVGFGVKVDENMIVNSPKLSYIGMLGTGYGNIDVDYARVRNITVTNVPGYATESVAELVFGMILNHIRELEKAQQRAREGDYSDSGYSSSEIRSKVFGVIGLGRNGSRVAEIALGFGADVRYWSRNRKKELESKGVKFEDIDSLIPKCDFLSLHLALTKGTEKFLDDKRISILKGGALVVNTSPMEIVDVDALDKRLDKGDVTFILDHADEMTEENLRKISKHKNCTIYPPIGYGTREARILKQEVFLANIESFLKGKPTNKVN